MPVSPVSNFGRTHEENHGAGHADTLRHGHQALYARTPIGRALIGSPVSHPRPE